MFWHNLTSISSEISRSKDIFIIHNLANHNGYIPIWAAVEVISFGTISKIIKNLSTGIGSAYDKLAAHYRFVTQKGNQVKPSLKALSSWIHTLVVLRNRCAHNARIYNRALKTTPEILIMDRGDHSKQRFVGTYQAILAMKYLRPDDSSWNAFITKLEDLLNEYAKDIRLSKLNFPTDWKKHLTIS
ncbi:MAG: Abi family protein [Selenomonadaceae bacterium]|nr:Abi family protein [Selenomonadaceae bacterium]